MEFMLPKRPRPTTVKYPQSSAPPKVKPKIQKAINFTQ